MRLVEEFDRLAEYNGKFLSKAFHKHVRTKLFKKFPVSAPKADKLLLFLKEEEGALEALFKERTERLLSKKATDTKLISYFTGISADEGFFAAEEFQEFSCTFLAWRQKTESFLNAVFKIDFYVMNLGSSLERKLERRNKTMTGGKINAKRIAVLALLRFLLLGAHAFVWAKDSILVGSFLPLASLLLGFPGTALLKLLGLLQTLSVQSLPTKFILPFCEGACKRLEKRFLIGQVAALNAKLKELNLFLAEVVQLLEGFFGEYAFLVGQSAPSLVAQNRLKVRMFTVVDYLVNTRTFSRVELHDLLMKTSEECRVHEGSWVVYDKENSACN